MLLWKRNEAQKEYCYKIKDSIKFEKNINFEIESIVDQPFSINFIINNKSYNIQEIFDDSIDSLNKSLKKINALLDGKDIEDDSENLNDYPKLVCNFEIGNEVQKKYCFNLINNFRHEKSIRYAINYGEKFSIYFILNDKIYLIQKKFNDSDESLNESLEKIYDLLDEEDTVEKFK